VNTKIIKALTEAEKQGIDVTIEVMKATTTIVTRPYLSEVVFDKKRLWHCNLAVIEQEIKSVTHRIVESRVFDGATLYNDGNLKLNYHIYIDDERFRFHREMKIHARGDLLRELAMAEVKAELGSDQCYGWKTLDDERLTTVHNPGIAVDFTC